MSDTGLDEIIKRRLLVEGDSGGDDKRIMTFAKSLSRWIATAGGDETGFEIYQNLLSQLAHIESTMDELNIVHKMNEVQQKQYAQLHTDIENSILDTHQQMLQCKGELSEARKVRRNRQEYDNMAKLINQHPSREDSLKEIDDVNQELSSLDNELRKCDAKLELRRKQFQLLLFSLEELKRTLDDDDNVGVNDMQPQGSSSMMDMS